MVSYHFIVAQPLPIYFEPPGVGHVERATPLIQAMMAALAMTTATAVYIDTTATAVYIDNTSPRFDVNGRLMDIHDGNLVQWEAGGRYYWYGIGYRNCTLERIYMPPQYCVGVFQPFGGCGFRDDHALSVYSSTDLVQWTYEGDALPFSSRPRGIYFRPKVIFDARTSEYVLWINYLRQSSRTSWPGNSPLQSYMSNITIVVGKSLSPVGPFRVVNPWAELQVANVGDFALLATADGAAYIAYDAWDNGHRVRVEKLNDQWTASAMESGPLGTTFDLTEADVEAPILFERRGWYYLIYGSTCCFCAEGGAAQVQVSRHPLGPWRHTGVDINAWRAGGCGRAVPVQNNFVAEITASTGEVTHLFMGDLWTSAPDGLKSHDLQFWAPLDFDDRVADDSPPTIQPLRWHDGVELDVATAAHGAAAPLVTTGLFRTGSALAKIRQNQQSCTHSGTFEAWLLALIALGVTLTLAGCVRCCVCVCCAKRRTIAIM